MKMQNFIPRYKIDIKLNFFEIWYSKTHIWAKFWIDFIFIGHIGHAGVSFLHIITKSLIQP
jgi:hypothetical protein